MHHNPFFITSPHFAREDVPRRKHPQVVLISPCPLSHAMRRYSISSCFQLMLDSMMAATAAKGSDRTVRTNRTPSTVIFNACDLRGSFSSSLILHTLIRTTVCSHITTSRVQLRPPPASRLRPSDGVTPPPPRHMCSTLARSKSPHAERSLVGHSLSGTTSMGRLLGCLLLLPSLLRGSRSCISPLLRM